jgi:hypothetical protein
VIPTVSRREGGGLAWIPPDINGLVIKEKRRKREAVIVARHSL